MMTSVRAGGRQKLDTGPGRCEGSPKHAEKEYIPAFCYLGALSDICLFLLLSPTLSYFSSDLACGREDIKRKEWHWFDRNVCGGRGICNLLKSFRLNQIG